RLPVRPLAPEAGELDDTGSPVESVEFSTVDVLGSGLNSHDSAAGNQEPPRRDPAASGHRVRTARPSPLRPEGGFRRRNWRGADGPVSLVGSAFAAPPPPSAGDKRPVRGGKSLTPGRKPPQFFQARAGALRVMAAIVAPQRLYPRPSGVTVVDRA